METTFTLDKIMTEERITPSLLAKRANLSRQTIYNLKKPHPKGVKVETLTQVIKGLRNITGNQEIGVQDILKLN